VGYSLLLLEPAGRLPGRFAKEILSMRSKETAGSIVVLAAFVLSTLVVTTLVAVKAAAQQEKVLHSFIKDGQDASSLTPG
jgi:hypothetical protein